MGIVMNIGELDLLRDFGELGGKKVSLRINPDVGGGECDHVITGGKDSKFGIYITQI